MNFTYADIAGMIDHSLLQQTLTDAELEQGCLLAKEYKVASVCIKPYYVKRAVEILAGSGVAVGTTIGFPHGGHVTAIKVAQESAPGCNRRRGPKNSTWWSTSARFCRRIGGS